MKLTVATNWDERLIDELKDTDVITLFGKLNDDIIGGGRPSARTSNITKEYAESYIRKVVDSGMEFNYLLNSSCHGANEYNKEWHQKMLNFVDWLSDIGVGKCTITTPYLMEVMKKRHPHIKISVSSYNKITTVKKAKFFEELGADDICVDDSINRDFEVLKQMKQKVNANIVLIGNNTCSFECPYSFYHNNMNSHKSQSGEGQKGKNYFYNLNRCTQFKYSKPEEIIKSRWIRPEDIAFYESIGIDTFKLVDRMRPTEWILNAVKAYLNREYKGNLAEILNLSTFIVNTIPGLYKDIKGIEKHIVNGKPMDLIPYIDNQKLDGFLDGYKNKNCKNLDCDTCKYCNAITGKVLKMPELTEQIINSFDFGWEKLVNSEAILN